MRIVLDENLPAPLSRALNCLSENDGHKVQHVTDLAPRGTLDIDLFTLYAKQKIEVHITQDHHHRKLVEKSVIASGGLIIFVLNKGWSSQQFYEKASRLVLWWPRIIEQAELMNPPAIFRVPWVKSGKGKFEQVKL